MVQLRDVVVGVVGVAVAFFYRLFGFEWSHLPALAAGAAAGVIGTIVGFPLDTLKTRLQTQSGTEQRQLGVWAMVCHVYATEGFTAFFHGIARYGRLQRIRTPQSQLLLVPVDLHFPLPYFSHKYLSVCSGFFLTYFMSLEVLLLLASSWGLSRLPLRSPLKSHLTSL